MKNKLLIGMAIVTVIAVISAVVGWYRVQNQPAPVSRIEYVKVPEIKTVTKIKEVKVPGPTQIVTIEKPVVVEKLKLPDWIKENEDLQVIATAEVPSYKGKTNTVAIIDTKTGKSEIVAKQVPLPFIDFINEKEVGIRAGYNTKAQIETTAYGKWDFLRIGSAHVGLYGEANSTGDAKVQLQIGYRF